MAQQVQAAFSSRPEHHGDADNLNDDQCLISDGSSTSYTEESLRVSSGAWNLYHVDRPPDLLVAMDRLSDGPQVRTQERADVQVTRGPAVDNQVRLERQAGDVETESAAVTAAAAAPISAACMPDASQQLLQEEQGEIIWPLNKEKLTVGEDGNYLENNHWRQIPVGKFQKAEIEIWGSISGQHPNILELYGAIKYRHAVIIFMEYMNGGSVEEYAGRMDELLVVHILGKVISAVEFMHSKRLLHRDIKGGNVLLDDTGQVKLADFGTSIRCDNFQQDNIPRGTEAFMAPEVCRSEYHSFSADIWSLMCLLHQMLAGKPPWMEFCYGSLIFKIGMARQPPKSPRCSPEVEDLFSHGFVLVPADRLQRRSSCGTKSPDISNIPLPSCEEDDDDTSLSSYMSGATESLVSELDPLSSDCTTGQRTEDLGNYVHNDDVGSDDDDDGNDSDDDSNDGIEEPDVHGAEAAIFSEGPWHGLDLSAEEQLQSLQSICSAACRVKR
ncbi:hypothetical protein OS493_016067 [Desmophyllum pertusum]|uniref:Protein kinase domain-containing protein n=1 Tax=Desmophyllum pertusum TaxID=174260 RepID=A0A9X0A2C8_9CNID|nr:hypothetical protein OS493_016067 [Desmophyllum pertusum]